MLVNRCSRLSLLDFTSAKGSSFLSLVIVSLGLHFEAVLPLSSLNKSVFELWSVLYTIWVLNFFFILSFFWGEGTAAAYGCFQVRGWIGAAAITMATRGLSSAGSSTRPLREARDHTCILVDLVGFVPTEPPRELVEFLLFLSDNAVCRYPVGRIGAASWGQRVH